MYLFNKTSKKQILTIVLQNYARKRLNKNLSNLIFANFFTKFFGNIQQNIFSEHSASSFLKHSANIFFKTFSKTSKKQ